jgi:ribosomal peptide maturation radical SAM protein 1
MRNGRTVLIAMPWAALYNPSIQIGILASVLERAGYEAFPRSYFLGFMEHLYTRTAHLGEAERINTEDYRYVSERLDKLGCGDWIFSTPAFNPEVERDAEQYRDFLREAKVKDKNLRKIAIMRELVPEFIKQAAQDVLSLEPMAVGFTSTFSQSVPSLVLAQQIKALAPEVKILFGGANCEGSMGAALQRSYPWVDIVVQGEAELALPALMERLVAGAAYDDVPGLVFGSAGKQTVTERRPGDVVPMSLVPSPNYDEYFARLRTVSYRGYIDHEINLPIESSRGCWWGAKNHCTFCGLNGTTMAFRSKDPLVVADEIVEMSRRYKQVKFGAVDNIIDLRYFETLLPALAKSRAEGNDLAFFYETKANLRKEQVKRFADAGVMAIQPGIESLSTPVLKLMRKGVTALQNIRLLKWAREYRIDVRWNILYGFPREPHDEYRKMVDLMPSLTHLKAPGMFPIEVQRFSPYFDQAEELGIRITGPDPRYKFLYKVDDATLNDIAFSFSHQFLDSSQSALFEQLRDQIVTWRKVFSNHRITLTLERGSDFIILRDRRAGLVQQDYTFTGGAAALYLACDAGATVAQLLPLHRAASDNPHASQAELEEFLERLTAAKLLYKEGGTYLALAVSPRPLVSYEGVIAAMIGAARPARLVPESAPQRIVASA